MLASHSADTSPSTCRHDIDTASEEPTRLDVADMVCVGADMLHGMLVCLLFFGEKIPNTRLTLPVKKKCSPDAAAHHHSRQFSTSEDGCNHRSEECVVFGRCWLTFEFDESRVAGWYHSPITHKGQIRSPYSHRHDNPLAGYHAWQPRVIQSARSRVWRSDRWGFGAKKTTTPSHAQAIPHHLLPKFLRFT